MLAAATVHFPYMTAWPERASAEHRAVTRQGFDRIGRAIESAEIETLIVVTSEHIVNLQPRMAPAFTIGIGGWHQAFPEPQFNLDGQSRRGDPLLARELLDQLYQLGFDPAHSVDLRLDHGTMLPLQQMGLSNDVGVVPLIVNTLFPPLPTLERCRALGEAIRQALGESRLGRRVAMLATGGISHTVGAPDFDREFLDALCGGDLPRACRFSDGLIEAAGNGTHEIRNWIVTAAAVAPARPVVLSNVAFAPGWNSGIHQLMWNAS
jgi:aromatic ring-opening dioxygenase catalytic subunit (LigB family)